MTTEILCDQCGVLTRTDQAVYQRVPHYNGTHWVVLVRMCTRCAVLCGWSYRRPPNPYFSTARQFEDWLQLTSS